MGAELGAQVVKQARNWVRKLHFLGEHTGLARGKVGPSGEEKELIQCCLNSLCNPFFLHNFNPLVPGAKNLNLQISFN